MGNMKTRVLIVGREVGDRAGQKRSVAKCKSDVMWTFLLRKAKAVASSWKEAVSVGLLA